MHTDTDLQHFIAVIHPSETVTILAAQLNLKLDTLLATVSIPANKLVYIERGIGSALALISRTLGAPSDVAEEIGKCWRHAKKEKTTT